MINFYEFKPVGTNVGITREQTIANNAYNRHLLAQGVLGITCVDLRVANDDESVYLPFAYPAGYRISTVEVYENGALNLFVRDVKENCIGFISVRP